MVEKQEPLIVVGQIATYTESTGKYTVKYPGMTADPTIGYPASLLGPSPFTDGGGLKSISKSPIDAQCLLLRVGRRWYIIGYTSPEGAVINDTHYEARPLAPGETFLTHNSGTRHGFSANGSIMSWASNMMNMILNPITNQMSAFFKSMYINWFAGFVSYVYDVEKKASKFTLQIKKDLDLSAITPGTVQKDRITLRMGALEDTHIADVFVKQEFDVAKKAAYEASAKLGKQKNNVWLDVFSKFSTPASDNTVALKMDTTGKITLENKVKDDKTSVMLTIDPAGSNAIELKVNGDKAIITITAAGDVTIKTATDAKIKLGGTGKEQQLVTKAFVEQIYLNHIHMTAAPGAPTTPPTMPPIIPIPMDSATSPYTNTTLAE